MMAAVLLANLFAAKGARRFGALRVIAAGALLSAVGCVALIGIARGTSYWEMVAQLVAVGAGLGMLVPPLTSALLGSVDKERSGVAAGVLNSSRQTGSVLGVAVCGSLIGKAGGFVPGMRTALIVSTALLAAAAMVTLVGSRWNTPRGPEPVPARR
jgi:DHA2 family methylenomycin A resistance protein-like MFS transporter